MSSVTSNFSVIFVNGVGHSYEDARKLADTMQNESKVEVELEHNPCLLPAVFVTDLNFTTEVIRSLRDRIRHLTDLNKEVLIIAHSYGAYITYRALQNSRSIEDAFAFAGDFSWSKWSKLISGNYNPPLDRSKIQQLVTVHAFGGVVLIPHSFGKKVVNHIHVLDSVVDNKLVNAFQSSPTWYSYYTNSNESMKSEFKIREWTSVEVRYGVPFFLQAHNFGTKYIYHAINRIKNFHQKRVYPHKFEELLKKITKLGELVAMSKQPYLCSNSNPEHDFIMNKHKEFSADFFKFAFDKIKKRIDELRQEIKNESPFEGLSIMMSKLARMSKITELLRELVQLLLFSNSNVGYNFIMNKHKELWVDFLEFVFDKIKKQIDEFRQEIKSKSLLRKLGKLEQKLEEVKKDFQAS